MKQRRHTLEQVTRKLAEGEKLLAGAELDKSMLILSPAPGRGPSSSPSLRSLVGCFRSSGVVHFLP
jgi:hypothetical protein